MSPESRPTDPKFSDLLVGQSYSQPFWPKRQGERTNSATTSTSSPTWAMLGVGNLRSVFRGGPFFVLLFVLAVSFILSFVPSGSLSLSLFGPLCLRAWGTAFHCRAISMCLCLQRLQKCDRCSAQPPLPARCDDLGAGLSS